MYSDLTVTWSGAVGDLRRAVRRLVVQGAIAALCVGAAGAGLERFRLGSDDADAVARASREIQARFSAASDELAVLASRLVGVQALVREAARDPGASRRLFSELNRIEAQAPGGTVGLSVYDPRGVPMAWWGSVTEIPRAQLLGRDSVVASLGPLGPRIVRIEAVFDRAGPQAQRVGIIAVERLLALEASSLGAAGRLRVSTSVAPVTLLPSTRSTRPVGEHLFAIHAGSEAVLLWGNVAGDDLRAVRERWRSGTRAAVLWVLAVTLLFVAGTLLAARQRAGTTGDYVGMTAGVVASLGAVRLVGWTATAASVPVSGSDAATSWDVLLNGLLFVACAWTILDAVDRLRRTRRRGLLRSGSVERRWLGPAVYLVSGAVGAAVAWRCQEWVAALTLQVPFDVLHFSLHPFHLTRWAFALGLVLLHAGAFWVVATCVTLAQVIHQPRLGRRLRALPLAGWTAGVVLIGVVVRGGGAAVLPLLAPALAGGLAGCLIGPGRRRLLRTSSLGRLAAFFAALWIPAFAFYPTLHGLAVAAKERAIETDFGPQAVNQRAELQRQLEEALLAIDGQRDVPQLVDGASRSQPPASDQAFAVWSGTPLKTGRLTSAVELFNGAGRLVSRFSMNLPGSIAETPLPTACRWDVFEESSSRGPRDRHVLRAARALCAGERRVGAIVVRLMLDYRALPFISTRSPYLDSLQGGPEEPAEGAPGRDVELASYGWSQAPLFTSGSRPWPLPEAVFQRLVQSRSPHWETVVREGLAFRVRFLSDRGSIYALGFPVVTPVGHVVSIAELTILAFLAYALLLVAVALVNIATRHTFVSPRLLIREVRGSFYRRLFLAFIAVATVPVFVLAVATRTYFSAQLRAGIEEAAAEAALVAQRLVEDYAVLEQRAGTALNLVDDDVMVLVSRAINQDVNLFARGVLQATSERDLFASGLLSRRTSGEVYRGITIDRLPTYVGREQVGGVDYLLAAAPVHAGGQDGIVTVPLTLRQRETERLIDEVDRRIVAASVLFVIVGAALGYWMAERIADPVSRLSRATRRIASGDLDARVAAESTDELGRLVRDFNSMAADLIRQRGELERSKRLEAWAEVARQVAHDIKNPLTPIQLAAEHARRVNLDRGEPLSPALDRCVTTILGQVTLLRQIASEFSSFASSPTAKLERTSLPALVDAVLEPYRTGLGGRVEIAVNVAAGLPDVLVDRRLVNRALTNIVENALHAMSDRGTLRVDVGLHGSSTVQISIADSGGGMDEDALARIFEPYFSTKTSGTGLGLTIAKRNVELNKGTIAVESVRGGGTTVTIRLPVAQPVA